MDRFEEMRIFTRVVEAGSITGASERLGIAKSAVSRRLADLEERLSVQLFRRSTRRMSLTDHVWPTYHAHAVYRRGRHLSARVRAFVDFLAERFQGVPCWDRFLTESGHPGS